tara:strand:- start:1688 stop:2275 length:588 start_codon:yes stop_codon:yes gene_type:complete
MNDPFEIPPILKRITVTEELLDQVEEKLTLATQYLDKFFPDQDFIASVSLTLDRVREAKKSGALGATTTGANNTFVGKTIGTNNTAVGKLGANTTGTNNTALDDNKVDASSLPTTEINNTAVGHVRLTRILKERIGQEILKAVKEGRDTFGKLQKCGFADARVLRASIRYALEHRISGKARLVKLSSKTYGVENV